MGFGMMQRRETVMELMVRRLILAMMIVFIFTLL
jgi:hypothetical protein